jgi:hypothetical protein
VRQSFQFSYLNRSLLADASSPLSLSRLLQRAAKGETEEILIGFKIFREWILHNLIRNIENRIMFL